MEQRKTLYKLREAIAKSEALYKERHLNIFEDDYDSDDDVDEDQIYSYYFDDHQEEIDSETDIKIQRESSSQMMQSMTHLTASLPMLPMWWISCSMDD